MKKAYLLLTICTLAFVFLSCKQGIFDQDAVQTAGTVYLNVGGQQGRAVDSEGLPVLKDAQMDLKIVSSGKSETVTLPAGAEKTWSGTFSVGEELTITVTVKTAAAEWSGSTKHTVVAGANSVSIKLNKNAAALNSLLFGTDKVYAHSTGGHHDYTLTLNIGSTEIKKRIFMNHSFCRDNKGRTYLVYATKNAHGQSEYKLERYTSEGERDIDPKQIDVYSLAYDYAAGKLYGKEGRALKEIDDKLDTHAVTSADVGEPFAVDNGRLITGSLNDGLNLSKIGSRASNRIPGSQFAYLIHRLGVDYLNEEEFFIRGDYLYILLSGFQYTLSAYNDNVFSLGAVIKWKLGEQAVTPASGGGPVMLPHLVGDPILIGKPERLPAFENHVLKNYDYSKYFYGAVKVIGFDDENLYIADDGFDAAYLNENPRIVKNRNRVAALNMETNELTFTDAGTAKWNNEWKEWKAPNTKTIVWNKTHDGNGSFEKTTFTQQGSSDELFETESNEDGLFAFDQSGILYIPYKDVSNNKIKRFMQKDNGTYEEGEEFAFPTPSHLPGAMAVDTSRSHRFTAHKAGSSPEENYYNVLYCIGGNNDINRFVWTDNFTSTFKDDSYRVTPDWRITALAANKDGLFVALRKSETPPTGTPTYGIKINRYDKVSKALLGTVVLVPEGTSEKVGAFSINEKITDMHIQDGNLYVLTLKEMREDNSTTDKRLFTSGKLWYISSTADFGDNKRVLYESREKTSEPDTLEKNFAPLRFIAVKPKKLVIASDGYYGEKYDWHCIKNFDKVFTFDIGSWNSPVGEQVENTTFTKVLTVSAEYEFLP